MKNRKSPLRLGLGIIFFMVFTIVNAQEKDPVILKVAGEEITKSEFLNVYQKNNVNGEVLDRKSLEEYMELYINFRLKVKEAESLGMDTMRSFIDELAGYRKQLAQPYLIDEKMNKALLEEAYNRKKEDIRASHILVKVDKNASPEDTLAAYKKIMAIRKKAMKGEDFGKLAMENSDDLSAKDRLVEGRNVKGNKGDLGYFTVFDMVYPFETGAYNTKVGEISMPVRSDFGYHLIKVTDRKPALGRVQVAHILMRPPANATAQDSAAVAKKVMEVYDRIMKGEDFSALAKEFSEDKSTATKGGVLPWFGANRMIPEFIKEVSNLKEINQVTKPFTSSFGWHIVKLIDRKDIGTYEDNLNDLKQNLSRSDRAKKSEEALLSRIKEEYKFTQNLKTKNEFYKVVTDTIFKGGWNPSAAEQLNKVMFTIGKKTYSQQDFAQWLGKNQRQAAKENISAYVDKMYSTFVNQKLLEYEDSQLENKYPEFKMLMKEYRDGILLFELTEQKIWSKASKDTLGLEAFYNTNKQNYMWAQRADASVYTFNTTDKKILDKFRALLKKGLTDQELLENINNDSTSILSVDRRKYEKGDNTMVDNAKWIKGETAETTMDGKTTIVKINEILAPEPKKLNEARGLVTANYQDFLEQQWIKELRSKYQYQVNQEVLSSIK
ncbi:MAG: peptidylprolyl isomerase [Chloroflexota bacterium]|nr:peptidylprolyl isomerase [Lentimicrobium sp.]